MLITFPSTYRQYRGERVVQSQQLEINSDDLTSANLHASQVSLVAMVSKKTSLSQPAFLVQS